MDDDDEDYEPTAIPGHRFTVLQLGIVALDSMGDLVHGVKYLLMQHHNWRVQRQMFEDQARFELEALVAGAE